MAGVEGAGLGFNRKGDPGRGDRDAVDVAPAPVGQRVAQPPAVGLEW